MGERDARETWVRYQRRTWYLPVGTMALKLASLNTDRSSAAILLWTSEVPTTWYHRAAIWYHPRHGHDGTARLPATRANVTLTMVMMAGIVIGVRQPREHGHDRNDHDGTLRRVGALT